MRLFALLALLFTGCPPAVCAHLETRCADDVVQICDTQGRWEEVMDCGETVPGEWECGQEEGEHTCLEVGGD
jgi:hypothetical protein